MQSQDFTIYGKSYSKTSQNALSESSRLAGESQLGELQIKQTSKSSQLNQKPKKTERHKSITRDKKDELKERSEVYQVKDIPKAMIVEGKRANFSQKSSQRSKKKTEVSLDIGQEFNRHQVFLNVAPDPLDLVAKLHKYQEKITNDKDLEEELNLYIKPCTRSGSISLIYDSNNEVEYVDLAFEIRKNFLDLETAKNSKVLLLTGLAGMGKSLFCRYLQKELMSNWTNGQNHNFESQNWFPIYMKFSWLKDPQSNAIPETLARELSLNEQEIQILRASDPEDLSNPHFLFIFDEYDTTQTFDAQRSYYEQDYIRENFCATNKIEGASWKNAKFIITCREESLRRIKQRELLFGPINTDLNGPSSLVPDSFLQLQMEPFSEEEITCYLKKYSFSRQIETLLDDDSEFSNSLSQSSSWSEVKKLEKKINQYELRQIARIPFMLKIITDVLPGFVAQNVSQDTEAPSTISLSIRSLIQILLEKSIKSIIQNNVEAEETKDCQEEDEIQKQMQDLARSLKLHFQSFALRLNGYSRELMSMESGTVDNFSPLILHPIIQWDSKSSSYRFRCSIFKDFFIAQSIEEEIIASNTLSEDEIDKILRELLISQRPLANQVALFLRDAVKEGKLETESLMNLVLLSQKKEQCDLMHTRKNKEDRYSNLHSPFEIAAANAITVLNAAGCDFSGQDLSNISIPGANLSYGSFEGTNFKGSNLQGVDFTNAWLKDSNLFDTNLVDIEFTETFLRSDESIKRIAYAGNGKHLAFETDEETVILKKSCDARDNFKDIKRLPGSLSIHETGLLGRDSRQIITVTGDKDGEESSIHVWEASTGLSIEKFDVPIGIENLLKFDPNKMQVIALFEKKIVQKYYIEFSYWINFHVATVDEDNTWNEVADCDLYSKYNLVLLANGSQGTILCHAISGDLIHKQHVWNRKFCKFNSTGTQFITGAPEGIIHVSDCIRGRIIKSLINSSEEGTPNIKECSFIFDEKQIMFSTKEGNLVFQDVATSDSIQLEGKSYALNPDGKEIALVTNSHSISFVNPPLISSPVHQIMTLGGFNEEGLNLEGAFANGSTGLSEQDLMLFQESGSYSSFGLQAARKLFFNGSEGSEDIRELNYFAFDQLEAIHARVIGTDLRWTNLKTLELSSNPIGEEGGKAIGNNESWPNLEELLLSDTEIGDEAATTIGNNQTWKNLKQLELASNKIGNEGAAVIGKSKVWSRLEILNLRRNEIEDEGAIAIGENTFWANLLKLDLSSNKISSLTTMHLVCSNAVWKGLKMLLLQDNPVELQAKEILRMIEEISSKELIKFCLLEGMIFRHNILRCLKYDEPKSVVKISEGYEGPSAVFAMIIGSNITWPNLQILDLSKNKMSYDMGEEGARALSENPTWINLKTLDLTASGLGVEGATELSKNITWTKLQKLNLTHNDIDVKGAVELSKNTTWINLQTLHLANNSIGVEGVKELSKNTTWTNLQALDLASNYLGDEGVSELSKNTTWTNLQTLNLCSNEIGVEGIAELNKNMAWVNLQTLDLGENEISVEGIQELSKNITWTHLQLLNLAANSIDDEGAIELSKNTTWINLQTLDLHSNNIGAEGTRALSKNTTWINLQTLDLHSNNIGVEGTRELSKNAIWINLQSLNLNSNEIGNEGTRELSKNITWTHLQTLDLGCNEIGVEGVMELSKNTTWTNLQVLNLERNSIGIQGVEGLSKNSAWTNLQILNLSNNNLNHEGALALSNNATWIHLHTLNLAKNEIGVEGARKLSKNTAWINLRALDLGHNNIGYEGTEELSKSTTWTHLQNLNLACNDIGDEGAIALSKNSSWVDLQILDLSENNIKSKGVVELSKNTTWINLQTFILEYNEGIDAEGANELCKNKTWINLQVLKLYQCDVSSFHERFEQNLNWPHLKVLRT